MEITLLEAIARHISASRSVLLKLCDYGIIELLVGNELQLESQKKKIKKNAAIT